MPKFDLFFIRLGRVQTIFVKKHLEIYDARWSKLGIREFNALHDDAL